ncbi:MAG: hypothetical protein SF339_08585 [Blastocatellia bacterium]|nr:hypothetical protein [Blastocatellia bacterium]
MAESQLPIVAVKFADRLPALLAGRPFAGAFHSDDDLSLVGFRFKNADLPQIQWNFEIGHLVESSFLFSEGESVPQFNQREKTTRCGGDPREFLKSQE